MAKSESTSKTIASLASKAMKDPKSLSEAEIKRLAASALTQAPDKPKAAPATKAAAKAPAKAAAKKAPGKA